MSQAKLVYRRAATPHRFLARLSGLQSYERVAVLNLGDLGLLKKALALAVAAGEVLGTSSSFTENSMRELLTRIDSLTKQPEVQS